MKNTNPNAVVTLGDLHADSFVQNADGTIAINRDGGLPDDRDIRYTAGVTALGPDAFAGKAELYDASAAAVVWDVDVRNLYSTQGVYLGSVLMLGVADLA